MDTSLIPDDAVEVDIPDSEVQIGSSSKTPTVESLSEDSKKNFLNEFMNITPMERAVSFSVGGIIPTAGAAKEAEDALPYVLGTIGGTLGGLLGHPHLGVGAGTTLGELEKQGIEKLKDSTKNIDVGDALMVGGIAAGGSKAIDAALKAVGLSAKLIPEQTRAKFFDKALQAVDIGRKTLSRNWERSVSNLVEQFPDKRISLSGPMTQIKNIIDGIDETIIPQIKTAVKRSPRLAEAVEDPMKAIGLTLKEAQELKNAISSTVRPIIKRASRGTGVTPNERAVFEVLDGFDDAITGQFPQMAQIKKVYAAGKKAYELARPLVERGTAVEKSIFSDPKGMFGVGGTPFMRSTQGKMAFKDITSQTKAGEKMFHAAELAHNLNKAADFVGRIGQILVGKEIVQNTFGIGEKDN